VQDTPLSTNDMRVLELNTEYLGISLGILMENAGREVARVVQQEPQIDRKNIGIFCGTGGNGGDGFVAARHLKEAGANVDVFLIGTPGRITHSYTLDNWTILQNLSAIPIHVVHSESDVKKIDVDSFDIIVDALLGFGLTSKVREPILTAIKRINKSTAVKYSIDVPSGIDSDSGKALGSAVKAHHTITMHAPKQGLLINPEFVGKLHVAAIGIPEEASHVAGTGDLWLFNRPRSKQSHKGDFGRILIIGGSNVFSGAPALAGMAALRAGADLVSVLAPDPVVSAIRSYSPNLMVTSTGTQFFESGCLDATLDLAMKNDVVAIGPGLGLATETMNAVNEITEALASLGKPLVIDADGLKALSKTAQEFDADRTVLTPHWGEMQILLGKQCKFTLNLDERLGYARTTSEKYKAVVLLKGSIDVVAHPDGRFKFNRTGHPAMTVGGTGDVLTGITACLLAQSHGSFYAASAAAFISGLAGESAAERLGRIVATDCIDEIPHVMMRGD
jgi:hydroxyethylthiazole kinase-like uncharacterized protein yjeF